MALIQGIVSTVTHIDCSDFENMTRTQLSETFIAVKHGADYQDTYTCFNEVKDERGMLQSYDMLFQAVSFRDDAHTVADITVSI